MSVDKINAQNKVFHNKNTFFYLKTCKGIIGMEDRMLTETLKKLINMRILEDNNTNGNQ